jgi:hypothetical protein
MIWLTQIVSPSILEILLFPDSNYFDYQDIIDKKQMVATFAGGCFWCMQPDIQATARA